MLNEQKVELEIIEILEKNLQQKTLECNYFHVLSLNLFHHCTLRFVGVR